MSTYAYDPAGRLQTLSHNPATGGSHVLGFAYNSASQIVTRTASNDAYAWTGASAADRPYSVNGQNQYIAAGPATFGYDPNGNLASTANAPHSTSYVYDVENRLVSASGTHNAELVYDPLGRLFQVSSGAGIRRMVYDGDALVAEYDGAGNMPHRYIHGNDAGADDPLVWYDNFAAGWRRVLLTDHQGSVIGVTDMYGNSIAKNSYDEYGIPGSNNVGRFGYTGQAWVPELGLWYYKARFYSPTLGRFLQVDPIGYEDGPNIYAYVGNDPVNMTDPTGQLGCGNLINERDSSACSGGTLVERIAEKANEIREAISPKRVASQLISLATLGDYTPEQIERDIDSFFKAPVTNSLDVAAAFPGGRAAGGIGRGLASSRGLIAGTLRDITGPSSIRNYAVRGTLGSFASGLQGRGFKAIPSADGKVLNYVKGDLKYTVRTFSNQGSPSVDVFRKGEKVAKIRIEP